MLHGILLWSELWQRLSEHLGWFNEEGGVSMET